MGSPPPSTRVNNGIISYDFIFVIFKLYIFFSIVKKRGKVAALQEEIQGRKSQYSGVLIGYYH